MSSWGVAIKIVPKKMWLEQLAAHSKFIGTPLDMRDGYIHMSAPDQVEETANKWFKGQEDLLIVAVDLYRVAGDVKWERSRNNQYFPHVYGAINRESVKWTYPLPLTPDRQSFHYPEAFDRLLKSIPKSSQIAPTETHKKSDHRSL